jgi:peptidoglycan/LPS O-acetylase OafA/YrhL
VAGSSAEHRIEPLDGLRAVAVGAVIGLHWIVRTPLGASLERSWPRLHAILDLGWCGVDLFFVLSGFLIGGILIDRRTSPNLFRVFWVRRALRILPVYGLALCSTFALAAAGVPGMRGSVPGWAYPLFLQNFFSAFGRDAGIALAPLWSLAIEEQFYLAGPLVARFAPPTLAAALVAACVLASPLLRWWFAFGGHGISPWDFTPCRVDGLALGVAGAWLVRDPQAHAWLAARRTTATVALAAFAAGTPVVAQWRSVGAGEWLVVAGTSYLSLAFLLLTLHVVVFPTSRLARVLAVRWLRNVGRVSYFLYAFHMLTWVVVAAAWGPGSRPARVVSAGVVLGVLAAASWRWIERPLLTVGKRRQYEPGRAAVTGPRGARPPSAFGTSSSTSTVDGRSDAPSSP